MLAASSCRRLGRVGSISDSFQDRLARERESAKVEEEARSAAAEAARLAQAREVAAVASRRKRAGLEAKQPYEELRIAIRALTRDGRPTKDEVRAERGDPTFEFSGREFVSATMSYPLVKRKYRRGRFLGWLIQLDGFYHVRFVVYADGHTELYVDTRAVTLEDSLDEGFLSWTSSGGDSKSGFTFRDVEKDVGEIYESAVDSIAKYLARR